MQLELRDPGRASLRRAARTAVVMPPLFALALVVLDDANVALFASFGTFAMLAFADFGGSSRSRVIAYLGLAVAGAVLIAIATPLSDNPWLGAAAMAVAGFVIAFSGVLGGYVAAAGISATLAFVLAVTVPAGADEIPARLAGWGLAGAASALAAVILWPRHEGHALQRQAVAAATALAGLVSAASREVVDGQALAAQSKGADSAVAELERTARDVPNRPIGSTARVQALAYLLEELRAVRDFAATLAKDRLSGSSLSAHDRRLLVVTAEVLDNLGRRDIDVLALERERQSHRAATDEALAWSAARGEAAPAMAASIDRAFRLRVLSFTALSAAANGMLARGRSLPVSGWAVRPLVPPVELTQSARRHAALVRGQLRRDSVWVHAGIRAGIGLGLAVLVAGLFDLSHAFWVALATLSVLKSNSVGTRHTAWQALLGTVAGFALASALVLTIGDHRTGLWLALPVCVFLAAYTPTALHFVVGQAMFTVLVVVLFNLLVPEGWRTGLARVEDIAVGSATAVVVGALLWPRGAGGALRTSLGSLFEAGGSYVRRAIGSVLGAVDPAQARSAGLEAHAVGLRASDSFATFLNERGPKHVPASVWTSLITAGEGLTFAGDALVSLAASRGPVTGFPAEASRLGGVAAGLEGTLAAVGRSLADGTVPEHGEKRGAELEAVVAGCLASLDGASTPEQVDDALRIAWTADWIGYVEHMLERLDDPLAEARSTRLERWWR